MNQIYSPYAGYYDGPYTSYAEDRSIQFPPLFPGGAVFQGTDSAWHSQRSGSYPPFIPGGGAPSGPFSRRYSGSGPGPAPARVYLHS